MYLRMLLELLWKLWMWVLVEVFKLVQHEILYVAL